MRFYGRFVLLTQIMLLASFHIRKHLHIHQIFTFRVWKNFFKKLPPYLWFSTVSSLSISLWKSVRWKIYLLKTIVKITSVKFKKKWKTCRVSLKCLLIFLHEKISPFLLICWTRMGEVEGGGGGPSGKFRSIKVPHYT